MKGIPTRSEWWESVRPYNEQGRKARQDGVPLSANPLGVPYNVSWAKGWEYEDGFIKAVDAREAAARQQAEIRISRRYEHRARYDEVAEKLSELGIDPYQLRDYLAGLPED